MTLVSFKSIANCPLEFETLNITDNRSSNGQVIVAFRVRISSATTGTYTYAANLPVNYSIFFAGGNSVTLTNSNWLSAQATIVVPSGLEANNFDFDIYASEIGLVCPATGHLDPGAICTECITSFHPAPGEQYVLSLWVKEAVVSQVPNYVNPAISLEFKTGTNSTVLLGEFTAKGSIVDGWQKIEEVITIPANSYEFDVNLINNGTRDVFFDDIRMHPFNASMESYVYDPESLRLWAKLDDRNYATFYQYDEEGKLIRVKKETESGVETIQESREGTYKGDKRTWNSTIKSEDESK